MINCVLACLLTLFVHQSAQAFSEQYTCEVKQVVQFDDQGRLRKTMSAFEQLIGKSFTVNRSTGTLEGDNAYLNTGEFERTEVISDGKQLNDFKSIAVGRPPTSTVTYIHIQEVAIAEGKPKPFSIAVARNLIISGTCK